MSAAKEANWRMKPTQMPRARKMSMMAMTPKSIAVMVDP